VLWEQRWHPLREEWVVYSAHRQRRPWRGERVKPQRHGAPERDPRCAFCPGAQRAGGVRNPDYRGVFAFDNDLPVVGPEAPPVESPPGGFLRCQPAKGRARVVCYTPRHDLSLAELTPAAVVEYLAELQRQCVELGAEPDVRGVLVFENRGEVVGVSNPHPHCQIYATNFVFKTIENEVRAGQSHLAATGRVLFQDVLAAERADGRRILLENGSAVAFVPYFARYPYEVFVAPLRTHPSLASLTERELSDFADVLQRTLIRFDNLWRTRFPYVMALHQAPTAGGDHRGFHFHVELHPPLRAPDLLKYPAGPEIGGGNYMNDTSPEETAAELRAAGDAHWAHAGAPEP
jgi:UDPglucose--hexose-1-phosphate uridylyltransferase